MERREGEMKKLKINESHEVDVEVEDMAAHLVSTMVHFRAGQIEKHRKLLQKNIDRMYKARTQKTRDAACEAIRKNIGAIEEMISKNIDDVNNFESLMVSSTNSGSYNEKGPGYIW
jgi:predicted YcjX-like family ATPase